MKTSVLQLEPFDDVVSTRDKMTWSKAPRILLVWPRRARILRRRVDLALLTRKAQDLGAQLALVTRDSEVRIHARELGVPVFRSTRQAQKANWERPSRRPVFLPRAGRPRATAQELRAAQTAFHPLPRRGIGQLILRIAIFLVGLLAVATLVSFFVPSAQVRFSPLEQAHSVDLILRVSPEISAPTLAGGVPARVASVTVEARIEQPTTGSILAPQSYAAGSATLTNLTASAVSVPAGTVLRTGGASPLRFALLDTVELPAAANSTTEVAIRALAPGSAGNVLPGEILAVEGSVGLRVAVNNRTALAGGGEAAVRAASFTDENIAQNMLSQQVRFWAISQLRETMAPDDILLDATLETEAVLEETRVPAAGQPADVLVLTRRAVITALVVSAPDLTSAVKMGMRASLLAGTTPVAGTLEYTPMQPSPQPDGSVVWPVRATQRVQAAWTPETVLDLVMGKTPQAAASALGAAVPLQGAPDIQISPAWWPRLPFLPFRILVAAQ